VRAAGDRDLLGELRGTVEGAVRWGAGCTDERGLISNRKAGIAAVEAGRLCEAIESEVFLHGAWLSALDGARDLARIAGSSELVELARDSGARAAAALETFWSEPARRYGFAHLRGEERGGDLLSVHAGYALSRGHGEPARALATARGLNHPSLASDWGARTFATDSGVYDPRNYNTGAVFPYLTNFATLAQYAHGLALAGEQLLASQVALCHLGALGFVQEHLPGDRASVPGRAVPHQIFSSAAILESTIYGLFGLAPEALEGRVTLRPCLPASWERAGLRRLRVGETLFDLELTRERRAGSSLLGATLVRREGPPLIIVYEPRLPALSRLLGASTHDGDSEAEASALPSGAVRVRHPERTLTDEVHFRMEVEEGPSLALPTPTIEPDQTSRAVRIIELPPEREACAWQLWGPAGSRSSLPFTCDREIELSGAARGPDGTLEVSFPDDKRGEADTFTSTTVSMRASST